MPFVIVAVMVVVPLPTVVSAPVEAFIVATDVLLDVHTAAGRSDVTSSP